MRRVFDDGFTARNPPTSPQKSNLLFDRQTGKHVSPLCRRQRTLEISDSFNQFWCELLTSMREKDIVHEKEQNL